jgi:hypothetical protein
MQLTIPELVSAKSIEVSYLLEYTDYLKHWSCKGNTSVMVLLILGMCEIE